MKNYKGWSGGFLFELTSDEDFQTFLGKLNYTESYWFAMNVNTSVPVGLPRDRYLLFVNITNATRGYLLAYPHSGTKIYRRALTGNGWSAWTTVNEVNAADLEALQTQINNSKLKVFDYVMTSATQDTSINGFNYSHTVNITGVDVNTFFDAYIISGDYRGDWAIDYTNGVFKFLFVNDPGTLTFKIFYAKGEVIT